MSALAKRRGLGLSLAPVAVQRDEMQPVGRLDDEGAASPKLVPSTPKVAPSSPMVLPLGQRSFIDIATLASPKAHGGVSTWPGSSIVPPLVFPVSPHGGLVPDGPSRPQSGSGSDYSDTSSEAGGDTSSELVLKVVEVSVSKESVQSVKTEATTHPTPPDAGEEPRVRTWAELQTQVHALAEALEGLTHIRVKQQEYLQRLNISK